MLFHLLYVMQIKRVFCWLQNQEPQNWKSPFTHSNYNKDLKSHSCSLFYTWSSSAHFQYDLNQHCTLSLPTLILTLALTAVTDWLVLQSHSSAAVHVKALRKKSFSSSNFTLAAPFQSHSKQISRFDGLILPSFKHGLSWCLILVRI